MENSILKSIKTALSVEEADDSFDNEIVMHINSVFSDLQQMGLGPANGFMIEDDSEVWETYTLSVNAINSVRSYMYLRVRVVFDPASLSPALLTAYQAEIAKSEFRLNVAREEMKHAAEQLAVPDE